MSGDETAWHGWPKKSRDGRTIKVFVRFEECWDSNAPCIGEDRLYVRVGKVERCFERNVNAARKFVRGLI